jgi:hypothetical protein
MFEDANAAIHAAGRREVVRRAQEGWFPSLVHAIDELLFELEELNLQGVTRVPGRLRVRSQAVLSLVPEGGSEELRIRQKVPAMMDTLFYAQELIFRAKDPSRPAYQGDDEEEIA